MRSSTSHRKKRARTGKGTSTVVPAVTKSLSAPKSSPTAKPLPAPKPSLAPKLAPLPPAAAAARAELRVQECSFVQWDVSGISAISASLCGSLIAVARSNGTVELRHKDVAWAPVSVLYFDPSPELSISAMIFSNCSGYLFIARLDGALLFTRVTSEGLLPHVELSPGGGAIWDLAVSSTVPKGLVKLALACDDGCVRFVEPDPSFASSDSLDQKIPSLPTDSAHYLVKISEATEARVLSVAWAPLAPGRDADCVACGDAEGGVRWINPDSGALYGRGKLPSVRREQTAIWTIAFAREGRDLLCGDSRGMATVWSSATSTLRQEVRIEGLRGALWSSTVVADAANSEIAFFGCAAGGVGGLKSPSVNADDAMWVPLRGCRFHSHDVRGMASFPSGAVISGSLDARMCLFTPGEFIDKRTILWVLPYHGCVGQPPVQFCRNNKFILSRRQNGIDLWSIPDDSQSPPLKLRMILKNFESDLLSCAISGDGSMVAASSLESFRLYQIWDNEGAITDSTSFGKVRLIQVGYTVEAVLSGGVDMSFCGHTLVCILKSKQKVALFEEGQTQIIRKGEIGSTAMSLERIACVDGKIAVCDSKGNVFSAPLSPSCTRGESKLSWTCTFSPEVPVGGITAISFSPSGKKLAIATSEFKVYVRSDADPEGRAVVEGPFSGVITSMSFSENEESLLISGEKFCIVMCAIHSCRKRKHGTDSQVAGFEPYKLRVGDSVLGSCVLGASRIAVVRRRWDLVQSSASLPDAIPKKPFGT